MTRPLTSSTALPGPRFYPEDLLPALQASLAALADLDVRFRIEAERLALWSGGPEEKFARLDELRRQHALARRPYLERIAALEARIRQARDEGFSCALH